jgi:uncharacterized membrane protein YkoI
MSDLVPSRWLARALIVAACAAGAAATSAGAQQSIKLDIPDSLMAKAKVTEPTARQTAQAKVPRGTIQSGELEHENGHLQYSYDIKVPGRSGITEVNVDALTGAVLGVAHEGAQTEAGEAAAERKPKP